MLPSDTIVDRLTTIDAQHQLAQKAVRKYKDAYNKDPKGTTDAIKNRIVEIAEICAGRNYELKLAPLKELVIGETGVSDEHIRNLIWMLVDEQRITITEWIIRPTNTPKTEQETHGKASS